MRTIVKKNSRRLYANPANRRGVVLVYTVFAMTAIMAIAALAVDMSWLYDRRASAQRAADAAALAGDWYISQNRTLTEAATAATNVAAANGYDASHITLTSSYAGDGRNYHVRVWRDEPMFFSYMFGKTSQRISAAATASFPSYLPHPIDPAWYGKVGGPYNFASYGPDNGATRGDQVNTRWNDITGAFPRSPNPLNYDPVAQRPIDHGEDFYLTVPSNYATTAGTSSLAVQIYDPDTYKSAAAGANLMDEMPSNTTAEKWRYTLYHVNTDGSKSQIAYKVYGEGDSDQVNTDGRWVTPAGFTIDTSVYGSGNYLVNVRTDDGNGNPGSGLDENGFLLRAGKPFPNTSLYHPTDASHTLRTDLVDPAMATTTDTIWQTGYAAGTSMGALTNLSINCNSTGAGPIQIYFGDAPANPSGDTLITFNGFDEDTGATDIYYTCDKYPGVRFQGIVPANGNGINSVPGPQDRGVSNASTPSNTVYFPAGTYNGGKWTAWYTTGVTDNTTWSWSVNYNTGTNFTRVHLIYTDPNNIY